MRERVRSRRASTARHGVGELVDRARSASTAARARDDRRAARRSPTWRSPTTSRRRARRSARSQLDSRRPCRSTNGMLYELFTRASGPTRGASVPTTHAVNAALAVRLLQLGSPAVHARDRQLRLPLRRAHRRARRSTASSAGCGRRCSWLLRAHPRSVGRRHAARSHAGHHDERLRPRPGRRDRLERRRGHRSRRRLRVLLPRARGDGRRHRAGQARRRRSTPTRTTRARAACSTRRSSCSSTLLDALGLDPRRRAVRACRPAAIRSRSCGRERAALLSRRRSSPRAAAITAARRSTDAIAEARAQYPDLTRALRRRPGHLSRLRPERRRLPQRQRVPEPRLDRIDRRQHRPRLQPEARQRAEAIARPVRAPGDRDRGRRRTATRIEIAWRRAAPAMAAPPRAWRWSCAPRRRWCTDWRPSSRAARRRSRSDVGCDMQSMRARPRAIRRGTSMIR